MKELNTYFGSAVGDLIYMLDRSYPKSPSIDLVGNRYSLNRTERLLLYRGIFDGKSSRRRGEKRVEVDTASSSPLLIDGLNVLITLESYLQGLLVFLSLDGYVRDVSEYYGSYKPGKNTVHAVDLLIGCIEERSGKTAIFLDRNAAASSECTAMIEDRAKKTPPALELFTISNPDRVLVERSASMHRAAVATSDTEILDQIKMAIDIPQWIIKSKPAKNVLDLCSFVKEPVI
jgi:hypothetical protein